MPFQKTIQKILVDDNRQIHFLITTTDDGYAGHLKCIVILDCAGGPGTGDVERLICTGPLQNAGLSGAQRTALIDALTTIYATAKSNAGYINVP